MTNYYFSGKVNALNFKTCQGRFMQVSAAVTLGYDFGGTLSLGFDLDTYNVLYGVGLNSGVGIPFPGPITGNAGFGISTPYPK